MEQIQQNADTAMTLQRSRQTEGSLCVGNTDNNWRKIINKKRRETREKFLTKILGSK